MTPAEAALLARRCDVAVVFAHPRRGRGLRPARPVAALGPGRRHRGRGGGQPEHRRRARDRQPGRHAVARRRARDRPGLVPGAGRRPGDRRGAHRRRQPVGPAARHLPRRPGPDAAARAARASASRGARRRRSATTRAPRSATAGSPSAASGRSTPSATASATRASTTPTSSWPAARRSPRRFTVTNAGERDGADVPQLYLTAAPATSACACSASSASSSRPASRAASRSPPSRACSRATTPTPGSGTSPGGGHRVALGRAADDLVLTAEVELSERRFGR